MLLLSFLIFPQSSAVVLDSTIILDRYVDVPDAAVSYDGYVCDIDNVGSYLTGQDIQASIELDPSYTSMKVQLVDMDMNQVWVQNTLLSNGKGTVTIPGQSVPSTYGIVVLSSGEYKGAKPVVISEYVMTVTPDKTRFQPGETLGVTITTSKDGVPADPLDQVKGILFQGSSNIAEVSATRVGTGIYKADIGMPAIAGTYYVNGIIATNDYVIGYPESVGIAAGGNVMVATASSSGSGSSVSSSTEEDPANILVREIDRKYSGVDKPVSHHFEKLDNIITYVNFTSRMNYGDIDTVVEVLNGRSSLVDSSPSGNVYRYVNIWVGNAGWATERTIANASISFRVEKEWISEKNIAEDSIRLSRYDDGWEPLATMQTGDDYSYVYFRAETPGFLSFVVTGSERKLAVATTQPTAIIVDSPTFPEKDSRLNGFDLTLALLAFITCSVIVLVFMKAKKI
ncbi:MAG: PGF-pre-PGF domain-containing protein [Methanosarcinales archaeon]|nr:PGF-pre-PGF domain-containing protein [Methanosarcinales archaeon]